jgi:hypothetical protein
MGYNINGGHIIYGRLTWRGARHMLEDEEGPKGMGPVTRSSREQMAGEEAVEKGAPRQYHTIPDPPH